MKSFAAFAEDQSIREIDSETPTPIGNEVLLRVTHSGVCHSDIHLRHGYFDLGSRGKLPTGASGKSQGIVLGHETVGEVVAVGPEVTEEIIGNRFLIYPWLGCGECTRCLTEMENACLNPRSIGNNLPGGYADQILVPHSKYLINIDGLDPAWAATLACSGVTSFSAIQKVLPLPAEAPIAIIGAGGVGLSAISLLHALGHTNILALDLSPQNLELAAKFGANRTLQLDADSNSATTMETLGLQPDAIIDFVNNSQTATLGFEWISKGGTMVQVGLFGGELVLPTPLLTVKMLTLRGTLVGNLAELQELVKMAKSGKLPHSRVQLGELSADGVRNALDDLEARRIAGRVVLVPSI